MPVSLETQLVFPLVHLEIDEILFEEFVGSLRVVFAVLLLLTGLFYEFELGFLVEFTEGLEFELRLVMFLLHSREIFVIIKGSAFVSYNRF